MIQTLMTAPALAGWRIFGYLACFGAVLGVAFHAGRVVEGWKRDSAALEQAQVDLAQTRDAAAESQRLQARQQAGATGATNEALHQLRGAAAATAAARGEREQLRDQVAELEHRIAEAADAGASCGADAAGAAGLQLLDACAGRYQDLAGEAGELAATVTGLQRWISGVCSEPVTPVREGGRLDE